jgi:hypothetical protein|nr:MAG TPA: hypothetical protein [Caudoviricetes sp.]
MKPYMITYRRKGAKGTLSRIVKANNPDEAIYTLKLKFGPDGTEELSVKDVRLLDRAHSEPFTTRHTDATSSFALHNQTPQRYRLINRHPGKGGMI